MKSELEVTTIEGVMVREHLTDYRRGLSRLVEIVEHLTPHSPLAFCLKRNKRSFLRSAVLLQPWAMQSISQMNVASYDFHLFATALHEGLKLAIETKEHTVSPHPTPRMHYEAALSSLTFQAKDARPLPQLEGRPLWISTPSSPGPQFS